VRRQRVIIVDDEPAARRYLRSLLATRDDVEIVGEAEDGPAAVAALVAARPDIAFLDVQLPGMDGFAALAAAQGATAHVVFVSAFSEHATHAFDVGALDFLVKPFDRSRLFVALDRAMARAAIADHASLAEQVRMLTALLQRPGGSPRPTFAQRIPVRRGSRVELLPVERIDWIEATQKLLVVRSGTDRWEIRQSLTDLAAQLDPDRFVRIRRSAVVNVERIRHIEPWGAGEYAFRLADGTLLTSGRAFRHNVLRLIGSADPRG